LPIFLALAVSSSAQQSELGEFEAQSDVGDVRHKGSVRFDAAKKEYQINASGENMWQDKDALHFVWRRLSGDLLLSTRVAFLGRGPAHRKAGWIVRQGLDPDSVYADVIVHADGLISLQYRERKGGPTLEIQSPVMSPAAVQLERNGDLFTLRVARENDSFQSVGSVTVALSDPVYVGLGVCSHDADTVATALFSNLSFVSEGVVSARDRVLESSLETISIEAGERRMVYSTRDHLEAPIGHVTESFSSSIARAGSYTLRRREACRKS